MGSNESAGGRSGGRAASGAPGWGPPGSGLSRRSFLSAAAGGAALVTAGAVGAGSAMAASRGGTSRPEQDPGAPAYGSTIPRTVAGVAGVVAAATSGATPLLEGAPVEMSRPRRLPSPVSAVAVTLPPGAERAWIRGTGPAGDTGWTRLERVDDGPDGDASVADVTDLAWVRAVDELEVAVPRGTDLAAARLHVSDTLGLAAAARVGTEAVAALLAGLHGEGGGQLQGAGPAGAGLATTWLAQSVTESPQEFVEAMPGVASRTVERWRNYLGGKADDLLPGQDAPPRRSSSARPPITRRAQWGASAPRSNHGTARPRAVILHHTATRNDYTKRESPAIVRAIQHHHQRTMGWSDVGYNLLIDRYGRIYEGRAGGLEAGVIGAHARGYNTGTAGVAVIGNHQGARTTRSGLDAVTAVLAWQARIHGIDLRDGARARVNGRDIRTFSGHRHVGSTSCPGRHLLDRMPQIQRDARR